MKMKKIYNENFLFALLMSLVIFLTGNANKVMGADIVSESGYQDEKIADFEISDKNETKIAVTETDADITPAKKDKSDIKSDTQSELTGINKNLLTPNESPGINTDVQKTKRYYDSLEDAHRTNE